MTERDRRIDGIVREARGDDGKIRTSAVEALRTMDPPVSVARIAELLGVTRQSIYLHIRGNKNLLDRKHNEELEKLRPFEVQHEHRKCTAYVNLTHQIDYYLSDGKLADYKLKRLRSFWRALGTNMSQVLVYDPEQEPNYVSKEGGWRYETRQPADEDFVVRPPGELTDEQKRVLRRPEGWESI